MNISSAIVKTQPEATESVIALLKDVEFCEIHLHEGAQIIITIAAKKLDNEIATIRKIEKMKGVYTAEVIYSYSEDELNAERDKIEMAPEHPAWLNDENVKAEDIKYHGDLRKGKKKF